MESKNTGIIVCLDSVGSLIYRSYDKKNAEKKEQDISGCLTGVRNGILKYCREKGYLVFGKDLFGDVIGSAYIHVRKDTKDILGFEVGIDLRISYLESFRKNGEHHYYKGYLNTGVDLDIIITDPADPFRHFYYNDIDNALETREDNLRIIRESLTGNHERI